MQVLGLSTKAIETVRVLKVQCGDASHVFLLLFHDIFTSWRLATCGTAFIFSSDAVRTDAGKNNVVSDESKTVLVLYGRFQVTNKIHVDIKNAVALNAPDVVVVRTDES